MWGRPFPVPGTARARAPRRTRRPGQFAPPTRESPAPPRLRAPGRASRPGASPAPDQLVPAAARRPARCSRRQPGARSTGRRQPGARPAGSGGSPALGPLLSAPRSAALGARVRCSRRPARCSRRRHGEDPRARAGPAPGLPVAAPATWGLVTVCFGDRPAPDGVSARRAAAPGGRGTGVRTTAGRGVATGLVGARTHKKSESLPLSRTIRIKASGSSRCALRVVRSWPAPTADRRTAAAAPRGSCRGAGWCDGGAPPPGC